MDRSNSLLLNADGTWKSSGSKTISKSFKIKREHYQNFLNKPYVNNGSVLVRLLLDQYFADKNPEIKAEFDKLLQEASTLCQTRI